MTRILIPINGTENKKKEYSKRENTLNKMR